MSQQETGSTFLANHLLNMFTKGSSSGTRWVCLSDLPGAELSSAPGCCWCWCHLHSMEYIPGTSELIGKVPNKYQFSKKESLWDGCIFPYDWCLLRVSWWTMSGFPRQVQDPWGPLATGLVRVFSEADSPWIKVWLFFLLGKTLMRENGSESGKSGRASDYNSSLNPLREWRGVKGVQAS